MAERVKLWLKEFALKQEIAAGSDTAGRLQERFKPMLHVTYSNVEMSSRVRKLANSMD